MNLRSRPEEMGFPSHARVVEVGPRDGLQSEPEFVPTEEKFALVNSLIDAGIRHLEVTSFVSPRAVPQMRDASEVLSGIDRTRGAVLTALVPNARGAERAIEAAVDAMVVFMSASESHNRKNVNRSRQESLAGFGEVCRTAETSGTAVYGGIATAFGCPFEGDVPVEDVVDIARRYRDMGITMVSLGDTTGMATPPLVRERCRALRAAVPEIDVALHFHNTRGAGLVCVYAGLLEGVTRYESSIGGLGGCPFAPKATGNICTEDLVYMLDECGVETDVDLGKLIAVARRTEATIGRTLPGQLMKAGPRLELHAMAAAATANG
ncbi:hydroxymethylglutaryl-CoA lyase [Mesorhizobium albiziae]|uniref:Hydroxymethylglutaryl-CoA lyase n=1 Tax=Neomesorhizobium albiziae TaxID=335020 RepID=A0A1I3Y6R0_9HYPH|nr:hydroxymethylglutaryl-CoA lyase [Mesorhizobium albiziae]GLS30058.1 hydroxymethylglutaryl-CoA lyase [Mesorhizobium albiziae]SFK27463.1 hydroxymethylglutaryl-CoA lyase [Mesorhizobium albiziae]